MASSEINSFLEEQNLWDRFRAGDADAFSELMKRYFRLLFRYGTRISPDPDFVKDCLQDVFFDLWEHRKTIGQPSAIKPYLLKAIRLRIFREQGKWARHDEIEEGFQVEFSIETKLIDQQLAAETHEKLERLLNELPKRQKEILYLRFYEELSHEDIARIMTMNRQSVYNLLHESIGKLRKKWHGEWALIGLFLLEIIN
ncbi:MAG: sigma-70 family RNA polymerase sigma factor [Siphonobacter sp.]